MKLIQVKIKYEENQWQICGDLKVVALILGLQLGYTNSVAFSVCGIVERGRIITSNGNGLRDNP